MNTVRYLAGMLPEEIKEAAELSPSFRGDQIFSAIHSTLSEDIDAITTLSKALRDSLRSNYALYSSEVIQQYTDTDGTVKLQIRLHDGATVESVLLRDAADRQTACLSTQVGCAIGCRFCKTGQMGLKRNLNDFEIVEQLLHLRLRFGTVSNIVFMGMGEPLANLENTRKAIDIFRHPQGARLSHRRLTISTCGLLSGLRDLTEHGPPVRLAVSLNSAVPETRIELMPVTRTNPLDELHRCLSSYQEKYGKRITLEYVLIRGINDGASDIRALSGFCKGLKVIVNCIPINTVDGLPFTAPESGHIAWFCREVERAGVTITLRRSRGTGIGGACGLLGS